MQKDMINFIKNYWKLLRSRGGFFSYLFTVLAIFIVVTGAYSLFVYIPSAIGLFSYKNGVLAVIFSLLFKSINLIFGILISWVVYLSLNKKSPSSLIGEGAAAEEVMLPVTDNKFNFWKYNGLALAGVAIILEIIEYFIEIPHHGFGGLIPLACFMGTIFLLPLAVISYLGKGRLIINIILTPLFLVLIFYLLAFIYTGLRM